MSLDIFFSRGKIEINDNLSNYNISYYIPFVLCKQWTYAQKIMWHKNMVQDSILLWFQVLVIKHTWKICHVPVTMLDLEDT